MEREEFQKKKVTSFVIFNGEHVFKFFIVIIFNHVLIFEVIMGVECVMLRMIPKKSGEMDGIVIE